LSIISFAGFALAAATWKTVEFYQFVNKHGLVAFDVARSGPDRKKFGQFITNIQDQIRSPEQLQQHKSESLPGATTP